jgi:hypothetical protein
MMPARARAIFFPAPETSQDESSPNRAVTVTGTKPNSELTIDVQNKGDGFLEAGPFTSGTLHHHEKSAFSIASVSTCGRVVNNGHGVSGPFDYGLPSLIEHPSSEDISSISPLLVSLDCGSI